MTYWDSNRTDPTPDYTASVWDELFNAGMGALESLYEMAASIAGGAVIARAFFAYIWLRGH